MELMGGGSSDVKPYEKLQRYWRNTGDLSTVKMTQESVDRLEARYEIRLPDDFRDYLLHSCPKDDVDNMDAEMTAWWPLHRLKNIPDEYPHTIADPTIARNAARYIFFADYCIWCWAWAIDCSDGKDRGRVAVIGGSPDRFVADSFADFVDRYVEQIWLVS